MTYTGRDVRRLEDADLLRGAGRFADDLPVRQDTLHAAILRSPHALSMRSGLKVCRSRLWEVCWPTCWRWRRSVGTRMR